MKTALTIAGSDCSGGAGIQADIKAMTMNGVYAMSVVTSLTAQNTNGVVAINSVSPRFLKQQLDCVFTDIYPNAIKIGMVSEPRHIEIIVKRLKEYKAKNIIVDPVMIATSGTHLVENVAIEALKTNLLPIAQMVTPNIPEAEVLSGDVIETKDDMISVAFKLYKAFNCAILLKGGHSMSDADDLLFYEGECHWFNSERINNPNTHGTGCTLSSAIASNLAKGFGVVDSVRLAKEYVTDSLGAMLNLGKGSGPLNHCFDLSGKYSKEANSCV